MLYIYFSVAAVSYSILAALPFITSKQMHLAFAILFGIVANVCWALISRTIDQSTIPIVGLFYDLMLTIIFLIVPFIFIEFNLSTKQIVGAILIILGIALIK